VSTGIVVAEIQAERDQPPGTDDDTTSTSRQPSATAAAARLPPEGPSLVPRADASRGKNAGGFVGFHPKMGRNINETPKRHTLKRVRVV